MRSREPFLLALCFALLAAGCSPAIGTQRYRSLHFVTKTPVLRVVGRLSLGVKALTVAFAADGRSVYVVSHDNAGMLLHVEGRRVKRRLHVAARLGGVTLGGGRIYVTAAGDNKLFVVDERKLVVLRTLPTPGWPLTPTLSPDGKLLAIGCARGNNISVYDVATMTVSTLRTGGHPFQLQFTPDGRRLFVSNYHDRSISVVSVDASVRPVRLKELKRIRVGNGPIGVALSFDGSLLYVANYSSNTVSVLSTDDYGLIENVELDTLRYPYGIQAAPGGGFFVSGSKTGEILWSGPLGERRIYRVGAGVTNFALSSDGRWLLAADFGGMALIRVSIEWTRR